jgi:SAM-dependent methyltransferase
VGNEFKGQAAHSAEDFGDTRDHWWNLDYLRLVAQRWKLETMREVLDVGCGVGHWGMLLASVMREDVRVTGVDREESWVEKATERAKARGLEGRFTYLRAEAQRLPFPDDTFDLVTCQTVLIHLPDPAAGITEMKRVTKPGGLVIVAEPNNVTETLLLDSITNALPTDEVIELVRFHLICERGKAAFGEGDNSLGDRVPGMFVAQGLEDVQVYVNDKATAIHPPYASAEHRAFVDDARDRVARGRWNWDEAETRRFYLAGGGAEKDFAAHFARGLASRKEIVRGIDEGRYHGIVGGLFYLIAGRKR